MASTNSAKLTIGGPEITSGSAVAREYVIPIRAMPDLDKKPERQIDPAIVGNNMDVGEYTVAEDAKGGIPISFRATGGVAQLLKSLLGDEETPHMVGACVRLRYTGTEASCKVVPANAMTVLCGAGGDSNANYNGAYFLLSNGVTTFYVWTDVADGSTDPGDTGEALEGLGYTGAEVNIATDTAVNDIAIAVEAVVEALAGVSSTVSTATVSIAATAGYQVCGTQATAVFTVSNTGTLTSSIGALASEAVDSNFGTAGVIDCAAAATDTVAELVAVIDAYDDYEAELVTGPTTADAGAIMAFSSPGNYRQGKDTWVYLWFGLPGSGMWKHEFPVLLTNTERSTYSIQKDWGEDNFLYAGCVCDRMTISGQLKAMVESDVDILGMTETASQVASVLTLEDIDPLLFWSGSTSIGDVDYTYVRSMSVEMKNNHIADGYGQGVVTRAYHQKAKFETTAKVKVRLDSDAYLERAKVFDHTRVSASFYLKGEEYGSTDINYLAIIELPHCNVSAFDYVENNGVWDADISLKALKPGGTLYNDPVTVTLLTDDSGTY